MRQGPSPTKMLTVEEYGLKLAADVATKGIRIALKIKESDIANTGMFQIPLHVEGDGRIKNKAYTMLKDAGILDTFTSFRPSTPFNMYSFHSSSRREPMQFNGVVNEAWFNKNAPLMAKAPMFETSGRKTVKKDSWSEATENRLVDELGNYRELLGYQSNFTDEEMIYIYLHLSDYDYRKIVKNNPAGSHGRHHYQASTTEYHKIYPKVLLSDLSKGVFYGHAMEYLDTHIEWVIKNVLGIKDDRVVNKVKISDMRDPDFTFKDKSKWTEDNLDKQIQRLDAFKTMLTLGEKSLRRLKQAVDVFGGWDKLKAASEAQFITYLEECFPLHIGDDEKDLMLKKLCLEVVEGKNKGFNERLQAIT